MDVDSDPHEIRHDYLESKQTQRVLSTENAEFMSREGARVQDEIDYLEGLTQVRNEMAIPSQPISETEVSMENLHDETFIESNVPRAIHGSAIGTKKQIIEYGENVPATQ